MLEAMRVQCGSRHMTNDLPVQLPDWSVYIGQVAKVCVEEASPAGLLKVRDMLYSLLSNCIPPDVIITQLAKELIKSTDDTVKHEIANWAAYYENRLHQGSKDIFHLEAFVAKFMAVNKRVMNELFSMMMA